jgi:hypothetical protein
MHRSKNGAKQVQQQLKSAGTYKGTVDGEMGPEMKQAFRPSLYFVDGSLQCTLSVLNSIISG